MATGIGQGHHQAHNVEARGNSLPQLPVLCIHATWGGVPGGWPLNSHHLFNNDRHHLLSWEGGAFHVGPQGDSQLHPGYPTTPKRFRVEEVLCH